MRLLRAIDKMLQVLASPSVDAPAYQINGVQVWEGYVAEAAIAARQITNPDGQEVDDRPRLTHRGFERHGDVAFVHGDATHAAWLQLCRAILVALHKQHAHAAARSEAAHRNWRRARRAVAIYPSLANRRWLTRTAAALQAADTWLAAAQSAYNFGIYLVRMVDGRLRPVGDAIARAGGLRQVAQVRSYHQAGTR